MTNESSNQQEQRVLMVAPTTKDGELTCSLLIRSGLACIDCQNLRDLSREIDNGVAAILLTEEAITGEGIDVLVSTLSRQPSWSDLPVVMMMRGGAQSPIASNVLGSLGNVTLLERPAPIRSVVSTLHAAVRSRGRQYQIREQMEAIRRGEKERTALLESEQAARSAAERASHLKDEFLATLSHELRTPLNAILGWSQILSHRGGGRDSEDLAEGLQTIERNARSQAQIIEDLLDMSRIISGKIRLDVQRLDLASIVQTAIATVRPAAEAKGIKLQSIIDPIHGVMISGDGNRIQQVLWNLLTNAVKFTPKGGRVQILLERVNSHLEISVIDTGEGIAPEFLPFVFDRFRQADASITRRHRGLGLGLSIVKQLVELHGGSVRVQSDGPGKGTTFVVALPLMVVHGKPEPQAERRHPRATQGPDGAEQVCVEIAGVRVLVVDDEPDARALVKRLLEECHAIVTTAASAPEALRLLEGASFDVLLSDIGMPDVDGYALIQQVRSLKGFKGNNIPAIALTAYARAEDRVRAISAGYQMHVTKPVEPVELITMIAGVTGRTGTSGTPKGSISEVNSI